jgi:hypothetical protein
MAQGKGEAGGFGATGRQSLKKRYWHAPQTRCCMSSWVREILETRSDRPKLGQRLSICRSRLRTSSHMRLSSLLAVWWATMTGRTGSLCLLSSRSRDWSTWKPFGGNAVATRGSYGSGSGAVRGCSQHLGCAKRAVCECCEDAQDSGTEGPDVSFRMCRGPHFDGGGLGVTQIHTSPWTRRKPAEARRHGWSGTRK